MVVDDIERERRSRGREREREKKWRDLRTELPPVRATQQSIAPLTHLLELSYSSFDASVFAFSRDPRRHLGPKNPRKVGVETSQGHNALSIHNKEVVVFRSERERESLQIT